MKQFTKKFSSLLIAFLLVAMLSTLCVGSAFAMVDISDDYYITDQADVISSSTEEYIISQNAYLEDYCSGAQIVVVVVDFLDGMDIEDYAYRLFDDLDIGSSTEDNGILLLLTIGEENYWCMQGRGLESDLPASTIDDILYYDLEPDFAERAYDAGVKKVFDSLFNEVCEIYDVDAANNGGGSYTSGGSYSSGGSFDEDEFFSQASTSAIIVSWAIRIVAILIIMLAVLFIYTVIKSILLGNSAARGTYMRPAPRPIFRPHRHRPPRPPHPGPGPGGPGGPHHGGPHPGGPGGPGGPRPSAPRPKPSRPSSGGLFGGGGGSSRGGGAGRRTSSSSYHRSSPSRSSFGGGSRGGSSRGGGMGRGGGGSSRGGGAGRRGR